MHATGIKLDDLYLSHKWKNRLYIAKRTRKVTFESRTVITIVCHITTFLVIIAKEDVSIQNNDNKMRNYLN